MRPYANLAGLGSQAGQAAGHHLDLAFRRLGGHGGAAVTERYLRVASGEPHPFGNFAVLSAPVDLASTQEAVQPLIDSRAPAAVLFPGLDVPTELASYLTAAGFASHDAMPAMAVEIGRLGATSVPDGYELVRVGEGAEAGEWTRQFAVGYELPLGVAALFSPASTGADAAEEAPLQFFAIRRGDTIVATSVCYLRAGLAGIYCVSTIPSERRKGLGAHATAEPLRMAARLGYGVGVLQSSMAGYGVYRRLGFADCGHVPLYIRMPD